MRKEKRRKTKGKVRRVCGMCKPHKKYPQTDSKDRQKIKMEIESQI